MRSAGFMMGQAGDVGRLKQVFFISEGWLSMMQKDKPPINPPSKDPNRKEVLLITQLALLEERSAAVCIEMIRNAQGRLVALKEMAGPDEAKAGHFDSPLLIAFVEGFLRGNRHGGN